MNLLSITYLGVSSEAIVMLVVTIVLLCLSALMSGSEAALFSLTHREKQQMEESGDSRDHAILAQLANVDRLLATILIANNLVNICVVITSSRFLDMIMQIESLTIEFIIKSVVVTFLLLLFGEILPKVFSQSRPYNFSRMVIYPIKVVSAIVYPISYILVRTGGKISRMASRNAEISMEELADAVDMTAGSSKEEKKMLSGIVNFVNTEVE